MSPYPRLPNTDATAARSEGPAGVRSVRPRQREPDARRRRRGPCAVLSQPSVAWETRPGARGTDPARGAPSQRAGRSRARTSAPPPASRGPALGPEVRAGAPSPGRQPRARNTHPTGARPLRSSLGRARGGGRGAGHGAPLCPLPALSRVFGPCLKETRCRLVSSILGSARGFPPAPGRTHATRFFTFLDGLFPMADSRPGPQERRRHLELDRVGADARQATSGQQPPPRPIAGASLWGVCTAQARGFLLESPWFLPTKSVSRKPKAGVRPPRAALSTCHPHLGTQSTVSSGPHGTKQKPFARLSHLHLNQLKLNET